MTNRKNDQYFRLGIFVLIGAAMLVALTLTFGARDLFSKTVTVETYIKESVQGLDIGAPVRFRGVRIGQVSYIGLSGRMYEEDTPLMQRKLYVVVRMAITPPTKESSAAYIEHAVNDGLRAQIRSQGITGVNYMELDFIKDPSELKTLPYDWQPDYPVIPSQPSPVNIVLDNIENALKNFNQLKLAETQQDIHTLLTNLNGLIAGGNGNVSGGVNESVEQLNTLLTKVNKATNDQDLRIMIQQLTASIVVLRQTLTSMQGDLTISADNVRQITDNVNDLSQKASQYPSWVLFGAPPKKSAPAGQ